MNKSIIGGFFLLVIAVIGYGSLFTVNMTQQAIVLQFGDARKTVTEPGLHFKLPFVQNVIYIDKRILNLDSPVNNDPIISSDQKQLVVDAFARYQIVDPLKFYQSIPDPRNVTSRLQPIFTSALRNVVGEETLETIVSKDRSALMQRIEETFNKAAGTFGLKVVDVRIRRVDLPVANSRAIFSRMETARRQEAALFRAQGAEAAQRIRSKADRDVTVLLAEANRDGQKTRGEGDATRNKIFADAYNKDPEFFAFYRSMLAYEKSLNGESTTMVVSPDSEFFRYFASSTGR
ncbi:MAG: membrane protease subunit HflC [Parvibaculaceae bacterium]|jgi:membrane protease subunit HflC|nr:protease modulator HflC [Parvibaculaceae bacterium]